MSLDSLSDTNKIMAAEVAWLSRPIVFEAELDGPDELHGGHLIVLHSPSIVQYIEGIEIRGFGQQGNLGRYDLHFILDIPCVKYTDHLSHCFIVLFRIDRYPIHFHMSGSVAGSIVRKNVIRDVSRKLPYLLLLLVHLGVHKLTLIASLIQSKQRCVVIHGSHDVMVEENVSFSSKYCVCKTFLSALDTRQCSLLLHSPHINV